MSTKTTTERAAGRDLDADLVQAVWPEIGIHWSTHPVFDGEPVMIDPYDDPNDPPVECPRWSTDACEALDGLVPAMEEKGYTMRMEGTSKRFRVWFDRGVNPGPTGASEDLAHAIALAALAALEPR